MTAGVPAPVLGQARPAARSLPQPCQGLSFGSTGYPPNQGISGEASTLETTESDAWGTNTNGGGVMKYNLSNQSLVASQCIVGNGGWLKMFI